MRSKLDPCLYFRRQKGKLSLLGLYVDDVLVTSESDEDSDWVMGKLNQRCDIRDLGEADKCLGISTVRRADGFILHQCDSIQQGRRQGNGSPMDTMRQYDDSFIMERSSVMRKAVGSLL